MTETPPVPGGLGAGTIYKQGALQITSRAELFTQMIVYPNGINVPNWIFTTATNRTEKTIEVVGIYIGTGASLGLFGRTASSRRKLAELGLPLELLHERLGPGLLAPVSRCATRLQR